jgi:hypothetical protein
MVISVSTNESAPYSGHQAYGPPSGEQDYVPDDADIYGGENTPACVPNQPVSHALTRHELRALAATHGVFEQQVIKDFCDSSERLEKIGAMTPTTSGLQYWVQDFDTQEAIIVAECVWLLSLMPEYSSRVPEDVQLAFEAIDTPDRISNAMLYSLWSYERYLEDWQTSQALQSQGQTPQIQPPPPAPVTIQQVPAPTIVLARVNQIALPQGRRTSGIRPNGSSGIHQYEWPESRKLAWFAITPRIAALPERALAASYCPLNSVALWEHVDVRLIGPKIEVNLVEIVAVSHCVLTLYAQDKLTRSTVLFSSSLVLESSLEALRSERLDSSHVTHAHRKHISFSL